MAGTITTTLSRDGRGKITRAEIAWEADASGNASGDVGTFFGTLIRVVTNPAADAPSDNYDVTLSDPDGLDVLAGQGANRDTANSEHFVPGVPFTDGTTTSLAPIVVAGVLTLSVSNAGDSNNGSLVLYLR